MAAPVVHSSADAPPEAAPAEIRPPPPPPPPEAAGGRGFFSFLLPFFCSGEETKAAVDRPREEPSPPSEDVEQLRKDVEQLSKDVRSILERLEPAPGPRPITPDESAAVEAPWKQPPAAFELPPPRQDSFRCIGARPRSLSDPTTSPDARRGRRNSSISALTSDSDSPPFKRPGVRLSGADFRRRVEGVADGDLDGARGTSPTSPSSRFGSIPGSVASATTITTYGQSPAVPRALRSNSSSHFSSLASSFKTAVSHLSCHGVDERSPFRSPMRFQRRPRSLSNLTSIQDSTPSPLTTPHRCSSDDLTVHTAASSVDPLAKLPHIAPPGILQSDEEAAKVARKQLEVARTAYEEAKRRLASAKMAVVDGTGGSLLRQPDSNGAT